MDNPVATISNWCVQFSYPHSHPVDLYWNSNWTRLSKCKKGKKNSSRSHLLTLPSFWTKQTHTAVDDTRFCNSHFNVEEGWQNNHIHNIPLRLFSTHLTLCPLYFVGTSELLKTMNNKGKWRNEQYNWHILFFFISLFSSQVTTVCFARLEKGEISAMSTENKTNVNNNKKNSIARYLLIMRRLHFCLCFLIHLLLLLSKQQWFACADEMIEKKQVNSTGTRTKPFWAIWDQRRLRFTGQSMVKRLIQFNCQRCKEQDNGRSRKSRLHWPTHSTANKLKRTGGSKNLATGFKTLHGPPNMVGQRLALLGIIWHFECRPVHL